MLGLQFCSHLPDLSYFMYVNAGNGGKYQEIKHNNDAKNDICHASCIIVYVKGVPGKLEQKHPGPQSQGVKGVITQEVLQSINQSIN